MCLESENKWGSFGKAVAVKQNAPYHTVTVSIVIANEALAEYVQDALTFLLTLKQQSRKTLTVRVMNSLMPAVKDICLSIISKKFIKTQLQVLSFIIIKA